MLRKAVMILSILLAAFIVSLGVAEGVATEADRTISFTESEHVVYVGKRLRLDVTVEKTADTAPRQTLLIWTSSDENVAAVNADGVIIGKSAGRATIKAAAKDNENIFAAVEVEVRIPVQSVQINENNVPVVVGAKEEAAKAQLSVTIKPEDAYFQSGVWSSSNEKIATVDSNGVVTGISPGNVSIIFTSDDPNGQMNARANVRVSQAVTEINLPAEEVVHVRQGITLRPEVLPNDATNKKLEFVSSDPSVATVSAYGQVTGVANGEVTITCKATDGSDISADVHVKVFQPVQYLKLDKTQLNAFVGKTSDPLVVTIVPENALYQEYTWSSSDESIATVNEKGEVTGIAGGRVQITATSSEPVSGNAKPKSVTCQVTVSQSVDYIWLDINQDKSTEKKIVLNLTVLPETATNRNVVWSSSDNKVATVSNGVVSIKNHEGTATITATAKDGSGIYANCDVNVGFSGSIIQIGNYVRRMGSYVGYVTNFTGNGKIQKDEDNGQENTSDTAFVNNNETTSKENNERADVYTDLTLLHFSSVVGTKSSKVAIEDTNYKLTTLRQKDPEHDLNAICFMLEGGMDFTPYSKLVFYIKDMVGSNTHKVTLVDSDGNYASKWIDIRSSYHKWVRVECNLIQFDSIDLESVQEIRIGEWNVGDYYFDKIGLIN